MTAQLVELLDHKYPDWMFYRTAMKRWAVKLDASHTATTLLAPTIEEALKVAVEFKQLPFIPRKPSQMYRSDFECVRDGSKWTLKYGGCSWCGYINTKREAEAAADGFAERSKAAAEKLFRLAI